VKPGCLNHTKSDLCSANLGRVQVWGAPSFFTHTTAWFARAHTEQN